MIRPTGHLGPADAPHHGGKPMVTTIVLSWNGAAMTLKCLEHPAAQTFQTDVIVIDNGSTDDSVVQLSESGTAYCELLVLPENPGFAGGMNVGIRLAEQRGADHVWLVNNDAFANTDCLKRLLDVMERERHVMIATPRLVNPDGSEQHTGGQIDWATGDVCIQRSGELSRPATLGTWITGTAPLLRVSGLGATGLFDPDFFAYWEDVDLSVRVFDAGGDLHAVPEAVTYHSVSASSGAFSPFVQFLMTRNEWFFLRKHLSRRARPGAFLRYSAKYIYRAHRLRLRGHPAAAVAVVQAVGAAFRDRGGKPPDGAATWVSQTLARNPWKIAQILQRLSSVLDKLLGANRPPPAAG
jgi:GT2 family glycosyltransferase